MPTPIRVKEEMSVLRNDADKIVKDISKLSAELAEAGIEQTKIATDEVSQYTKEKMQELRQRMLDAEKLMSTYSTKMEDAVKAHPYAFLAGTVGIGWIIGKFLSSKRQASRANA
jgi:ElaB/YqjD/DUF883 family membrane-anchored ribosome-binding protein